MAKGTATVAAALLAFTALTFGYVKTGLGDGGKQKKAHISLDWPKGDPDAGAKAFEALKCYSCHLVPSHARLKALSKQVGSAGPGPNLTGTTAQRSRMEIMRQIALPGSDPAIAESHMGSFAHTMTVKQLTDLVAFMESLPPK
ncbi:MAG: c-type cytochrome [Proteobacteria bacterium]|nr:c-type cytochrome [Pseudomonadota bacterium]